MTAPRPSFIMSKGERNRADCDSIDTSQIIQHYRDVVRGVLKWDGMPEDMPEGYVNDTCLFYGRGFAAKEVSGFGPVVMPANPVTLNFYGAPVEWLPALINGVTAYNEMDPWIYQASDTPVCWFGYSLNDKILPYVQLMEHAMLSLGTNLVSLRQPVLVSGTPAGQGGDNVGSILLRNDVYKGTMFLPIVEGRGAPLEVLDLKATDHTQNLISTIQACDARILEILNTSNGIQKSSGITVEETATGELPVNLSVDALLNRCKAWCDRTNDVLGTSFSVSKGTGWTESRKEGAAVPLEEGGNDTE